MFFGVLAVVVISAFVVLVLSVLVSEGQGDLPAGKHRALDDRIGVVVARVPGVHHRTRRLHRRGRRSDPAAPCATDG